MHPRTPHPPRSCRIVAERPVPPELGVHHHPINPSLRPFVYRIGGFEDRGDPIVHRELPLVGTPLILTFGAPYQLSTAANPDLPIVSRPAFVAGLHHRYTTSRATGPNWSIQVDLTPVGAYRILGLPLEELTGRAEAVTDVLGADGQRLIADVGAAANWEARFDLIEAFLWRRLERGRAETAGIAWAWRQLAASYGGIPIGDLAGELAWSRRHFSQRFRRELGLPPKTLARQLRFVRAVTLIQRPSTRSLADIAIRCGFADQAHLTREFRELAGVTPAVLRQERQTPGDGDAG